MLSSPGPAHLLCRRTHSTESPWPTSFPATCRQSQVTRHKSLVTSHTPLVWHPIPKTFHFHKMRSPRPYLSFICTGRFTCTGHQDHAFHLYILVHSCAGPQDHHTFPVWRLKTDPVLSDEPAAPTVPSARTSRQLTAPEWNAWPADGVPREVQRSTDQLSTVLYSAVQYSSVQYTTALHSTVQYDAVQYSTGQYSTVQSN